jgi:hypothetical protein
MTLEDFIDKISDFNTISSAKKIPYFAYYLQEIKKLKCFQAKDIINCFEILHVDKYSNTASYLLSKSKGKDKLFLKNKKNNGYVIEKKQVEKISVIIGTPKKPTPSNDLFSLEIFDNTRGYITKTASEASVCYDYSLYNACWVMIRKLVETLIIELFKHNNIADKIKKDGNFLYLSDLIDKLQNESTLHLTRNTMQGLPKIKKYGDLSAHNVYFDAKKSEIDSFKMDLRIVLEELIQLIDYPNRK